MKKTLILLLFLSQFASQHAQPVIQPSISSDPFNNKMLEQIIQTTMKKIRRELMQKKLVETFRDHGQKEFKYNYSSDNVTTAEKVIRNVLATTDVSSALTRPQDPSLVRTLKASLERVLLNVFTQFFLPSFRWCSCVTDEKRIAMAIRLVHDVTQRFKPEQHLVYTSLASGSLLQDYVIVKELQSRGYKNIDIVLIDPGYFSMQELRQMEKLSNTRASFLHAMFLVDLLGARGSERYEKIQAVLNEGKDLHVRLWDSYSLIKFKDAFDALEPKEPNQPGISVLTYENVHDYLDAVARNPWLAADILLLTDPSGMLFPAPPYPSQADAVAIELTSPDMTPRTLKRYFYQEEDAPSFARGPSFFIFLPRQAGARVYTNKNLLPRFTLTRERTKMAAIQEQIMAIIKETKADTQFSPSFVTKIIETFGEQPEVKLSWFADAYMDFQLLVQKALRNPQQSVVYFLDIMRMDVMQRVLHLGRDNVLLERIDPIRYRTIDVIAPEKGKMLEQGYRFKRIL